jgi:cold-inducible RNA-binding protein
MMAVRLFVGNLPYDATEAELRQHFSAAGQMSYVYIATDRESGRPRGFAFVEFDDPAAAAQAIRLFNDRPFKGRPIAVNEARAREARPPGGVTARPSPSRSSFSPEPPPTDAQRGERTSREFGPDRPPRRARKVVGRGAKSERGPKGPIRERGGGRFFGSDDIEADDDLTEDNFASRVENDQEDDD